MEMQLTSYAEEVDDEEDIHQPPWLTKRGFIDLRNREAEEFNDLITLHLPHEVKAWECLEEKGWIFKFDHLTLEIMNQDLSYAFDQGEEHFQINAKTDTISRTYIDPLRRLARSFVSESLPTCCNIMDFAIMLLRLLEEATATIYEWENSHSHHLVKKTRGWDVNTTAPLNDLYLNPHGADLSTIDTSGNDLLGSSIQSICETIPSSFRILHVEPVFRNDLVMRFKRRRRRMAEQLSKLPYSTLRQCVPHNRFSSAADKSELIGGLCRPRVTFHGTQRHLVSSIVRHGFVVPGEKIGAGKEAKKVEIRCGASFGVGIYSSPDPEYALYYANMSWEIGSQQTRPEDLPGLRLIVCAVLMGRPLMVTRDQTRRTEHIADATGNSHVSPNMLEYVVFENAQIIPCYVIHLDMGADTARQALERAPSDPNNFVRRKLVPHPKLNKTTLWPAEVEALKAAKKAAAAKWFPYGFGPAKGTSFVIEEIGETSDDEEDYGEWQGERKEVENEITQYEEQREKKGGSWFDEYQDVRWTLKKNINSYYPEAYD